MVTQDLIDKWIMAKETLTKSKNEELKLRELIVIEMGKDGSEIKLEGTTKRYIGNNILSVSFKTRKTIDESIFSSEYENLSDKEKECFILKPVLVNKKYREMENSPAIAKMITVTPSLASVSIKEKLEEDEYGY